MHRSVELVPVQWIWQLWKGKTLGKIKKNVLVRSFELDAKKKGTNSKEWIQNCPCTVRINWKRQKSFTLSPSTRGYSKHITSRFQDGRFCLRMGGRRRPASVSRSGGQEWSSWSRYSPENGFQCSQACCNIPNDTLWCNHMATDCPLGNYTAFVTSLSLGLEGVARYAGQLLAPKEGKNPTRIKRPQN